MLFYVGVLSTHNRSERTCRCQWKIPVLFAFRSWRETILFYTWCCCYWGGGGWRKGRWGKKPPKDPNKKMLKPRLRSERFIKRRLNPLLTTEKQIHHWALLCRAPCNRVCLYNQKFPHWESIYDWYYIRSVGRYAGGRKTKDHFTVHSLFFFFCTPLSKMMRRHCHS